MSPLGILKEGQYHRKVKVEDDKLEREFPRKSGGTLTVRVKKKKGERTYPITRKILEIVFGR